MGLFDNLGSVVGAALGDGKLDIASIAEQALGQSGGLGGLVGQLQQAGLADQVTSWLGNGENKAVSADEMQSAIPMDQLAGLAKSFGVDVSALPQMLAEHLPAIIDKASPNGKL